MSHDAFMRAIRAAPGENGPRLVYADWLEENGEPWRAELIRVQCARAGMLMDDPDAPDLNERIQTLLKNNWEALVGPLRRIVGPDADRVGEAWLLKGYHPFSAGRFHRGFVDDLSLTAKALLDSADELFRTAPLRHLRLWRAGADAPALARLPHLADVQKLEFADPWGELLRAEGMSALAASPYLSRLTTLKLPRNDIADAGAVALAGAAWLAGLDTLDLEENGISDAGVEALAASPGVSGLARLELRRNRVTIRGVRALAGSPYLTGLRRLGLDEDAANGAAVREALGTSPYLHRNLVVTFHQPR